MACYYCATITTLPRNWGSQDSNLDLLCVRHDEELHSMTILKKKNINNPYDPYRPRKVLPLQMGIEPTLLELLKLNTVGRRRPAFVTRSTIELLRHKEPEVGFEPTTTRLIGEELRSMTTPQIGYLAGQVS